MIIPSMCHPQADEWLKQNSVYLGKISTEAKQEAHDYFSKHKSMGGSLRDVVIRLIHVRRYSLHGKANRDDHYLQQVVQELRNLQNRR